MDTQKTIGLTVFVTDMAASGAHSDGTSQDIQIVLILSSPKNRLYSIYHQTRSPLRPSAAEINTPTHLSKQTHKTPKKSEGSASPLKEGYKEIRT